MICDGLIWVFNKSYLFDLLKMEIVCSKWCKWFFLVMMLDIDFFKKVNDIYGYLVGDEVLKEFC